MSRHRRPHHHYHPGHHQRWPKQRHYPSVNRPHHSSYWYGPVIFFGVPLIIIGAIVASFMGVQPLASVKDKVVAAITSSFAPNEQVIEVDEQAIKDGVFAQINQVRRENGLSPLQRNSFLDALAQQHCKYMESTQSCNHDAFEDRVSQIKSNLGTSYIGENAAEGYWDANELVNGWLTSPGHRGNIMDPGFTRTGIGFASGYACQIFSD